MPIVDEASREIAVKIVYYGPALSGKTTNLQALYQRIDPAIRGRLLSLDTSDDRTLFLDLLPVFYRSESGAKIKLKLFTAPGQVMHESTRRIVLQGCDAVAFVADSRRAERAVTISNWNNMLANLATNGISPHDVPIVFQLNKRDLPDAQPDQDVSFLGGDVVPPLVTSAVAVRGEGVVETLHALLSLSFRRLDARHRLGARLRITEEEFLGRVFSHVDLTGTRFAGGAVR